MSREYGIIAQNNSAQTPVDYSKIRVGRNVIKDDAFLDVDYLKPRQRRIKRKDVERAIDNQDLNRLIEISDYFFYCNGIYERLCRYMAYLYRYDWFITPIKVDNKINDNKVVEGWYKSARYLDNSDLKRWFGEVALKVIKNGCYYGYVVKQKDRFTVQELPIKYCRSKYTHNGRPAVEFNVKYFDDCFSDIVYREKVLKLFPQEFRKAYLAFKKNNLPKDSQKDDPGWFLLDLDCAVKFNLNKNDFPLFISVIPKLLDLEDAQDLDKKKMAQQLLRLVIQEMPLDKNFDPVFDIPEIRAFHDNAVQMVGDGTGISVLTTLADVKVEDLSDNSTISGADQLEKIERGVYNEAGVSQLQFNADGNIALEKSIANDEASMSDLIYQFEEFLNDRLTPYNKGSNRLVYQVKILPTTIYNYKDLSKLFKEQTTLGFSKLLPQVALGLPQSVIIATAYFENDMLNLDEVFVPPMSSNTMSTGGGNSTPKKSDSGTEASGGAAGGRPEKPDDEKSEKTMKNIESQS